MNRWKDWYAQGKRDLERAKLDFSDHLRVAVDVLVTDLTHVGQLEKTVGGSVVIAEKTSL